MMDELDDQEINLVKFFLSKAKTNLINSLDYAEHIDKFLNEGSLNDDIKDVVDRINAIMIEVKKL